MTFKIFLMAGLLLSSPVLADELSLNQLIRMGYDQNLTIKAYQAQISALAESATAKSTPSSPNIGVSELQRGMTTRYITISQKIEFPTKYGLRDDIESHKRQAKEKELDHLKLKIRSKIVTLYYAIFSVNKIISLTKDDLQNVKELSRIAETKYAAGKAPMHDSMKVHVLQTQIETDLISLRQEEYALQARLRNFLNQPNTFRIDTPPKKPDTPSINISHDDIKPNSRFVQQKQAEYETAKLQAKLASWNYAPDFNLRYQDRISGEPEESRSIALEMSVPLWFWGKTAAQRSASHTETAKRFEVEAAILDTNTGADELYTKAKSQKELLDIMDTALIPQAQTSFSTTLDAYKASKSTFLDLLDAERSLLKVQIAYYRMLTQYIENITALETTLNRTVAELAL